MQLEALDHVVAEVAGAPDAPTRVPVRSTLPDSGFVSVRLSPPEVTVQPGSGP
jgi:hypothetical protein